MCKIAREGEKKKQFEDPSFFYLQFGSSVIWCMISRGETLYASVSPVDMEIEHQNAW